jgi:protein TonB
MRADVLESGSGRERIVLVVALVLSVLGHLAFAFAVSHIPEPDHGERSWVQMAVAVTEPPPPPDVDPPKPVEPEKPKPKPKPVEFEEIPKEPPPAETPPPEAPKRRVVQGLTANSFAQGANTGLTVRAGTTTRTKAGDTMSVDEANGAVAFASVTAPPKIKPGSNVLVVPQDVIDLGIVGRVEVELVVGSDGSVSGVTVVSSLHEVADRACVAHAKTTRWSAGTRDGTPVVVRGVPFSCRFEKIED